MFFTDSDYEHYLELLMEGCAHEGIEIWAYCLMTNHVRLIVKPEKKSNLAKAIDEVHRRYTRMINLREEKAGRLLQRDLKKKNWARRMKDIIIKYCVPLSLGFYNKRRLHSSLNYMTPGEYEVSLG